jgi:hypothetical protein
MALAAAAKFEKQGTTARAQIASAFRGVYGRAATDKEIDVTVKHYEKMLAHHRRVKPPQPAEPAPVVHMITSELTGERHEFIQQPDVVEHEKNLHPSQVGPSTRALGDVVLALFNSNEFVYIY